MKNFAVGLLSGILVGTIAYQINKLLDEMGKGPCPYCKKPISVEALRCFHCHTDIHPFSAPGCADTPTF